MFGVGLGGVRCVFCRPCPVLCVVCCECEPEKQCTVQPVAASCTAFRVWAVSTLSCEMASFICNQAAKGENAME